MAVWYFYLDASALAKRYTVELGTAIINYLFSSASPDRLYLLNIGIAEIVSVLVRKKNSGRLSVVELNQALIDIGAEISFSAVNKETAENHLVTGALTLIQSHSINSTDAIILRSALDLASQWRTGGDDFVLVASDQRLLRAAQAEGLKTFDPETQPLADLAVFLGP